MNEISCRLKSRQERRRGWKKDHLPDVASFWAEGGPLDTFYAGDGGALGIWRKWADNLQGQSMKGGHIFPEENPEQTIEILRKFLAA